MTHWQRIDAAFEALQQLPPEQHPAFLEQLAQEDPNVAQRVSELMHLLNTEGDFLEEQAGRFAETMLLDVFHKAGPDLDIDPERPTTLGPYRLERTLGKGGMGVVYLAHRWMDDVQQQVALKVIKRGLDSEAVVQRFRQERAVLASLNHPNITRLLDGGTAQNGQLYFAMEYIEGVPITTYCDTHKLSVDARLALFETVCEAVQYAHQNLVVHRDLKPSNILVTPAGEVKLLDFGIAKLLEGASTDWSVLETALDQRVLTPAYAAPEQLQGTAITTASDVYALGILLYELLVGQRPFEQAARHEMERLVLEVLPERPSTAVGSALDDPAAEQLAATRQTSIERLRRRLKGDLDLISLKALAKEAQRRYRSAGALAADIRRHLAGLPVEAQPDRLSYRLRKLVRRNQRLVSLVAGFLVVLVGVVTTYTVRQAQLVDDLVQEAQKTTAVKNFLLDMFTASDPYQVEPRDSLYVRDFLDEGVVRIPTTLAHQPAIQAEMLATLGSVYLSLGIMDRADSLIVSAHTMRERLFAATHPDRLNGAMAMALLRADQGRYREADSLYASLLTHYESYGPTGDVGKILRQLAIIRIEQAAFSEAEAAVEQALDLYENQQAPDSLVHLDLLTTLVDIYSLQGRLDETLPLYEEVFEIAKRLYGSGHPATTAIMANWADNLLILGNVEEAEPLFRQVLAHEQKALGPRHPDTNPVLVNLGIIAHAQGDYARAESLFVHVLDIYEEAYQSEHDAVAETRFFLGAMQCDKGDWAAAAETFEGIAALLAEVFSPEAPHIGFANALESECAMHHGHVLLADSLAQHAMRLLVAEEDAAMFHPFAYAALGAARAAEEDYEEAEDLLMQAYEGLSMIPGYIPNRLDRTTQRLIDLYEVIGQVEKAKALRQSDE